MSKQSCEAPGRLHESRRLEVGGGALNGLLSRPLFQTAFRLQIQTLETFCRLARPIAGLGCPVGPVPRPLERIERNFFSTFFLAVTSRMLGRSRYLPLYAMVNQGMRAWVTACDNILDDEYKEVFSFALAETGPRMKSVLTLLIADRVVADFVVSTFPDAALLSKVGKVSLQSLLPSALQECDEEIRPVPILPAEEILGEIHQRKTGDLFRAPLALPLALEPVDPDRARAADRAVGSFGLACQVIDDIKDMPDDVRSGRHNLLVSIATQATQAAQATRRRGGEQWLAALRAEPSNGWTAWQRFGAATAVAQDMALDRFRESFDALSEIDIEFSPAQRTALVACVFGLLKVPFIGTGVQEGVG